MKHLSYFVISCVWISCVYAQALEHQNVDAQGVALSGYDPVSYFVGEAPVKGLSTLSVTWKGATYYFASKANKAKFEAAPKDFLPQYGGWCAYAIGAAGKKYGVHPESYVVKEGKLYLFYKKGDYDASENWAKEEDKLLPQADKAWRTITDTKDSAPSDKAAQQKKGQSEK